MSADYRKAAKNLHDAILDNSHLTAEELRKNLADEGVNVEKFLDRVNSTFRKGLQAQAKQQAVQAKEAARATRGSIFGDLGHKSRSELLSVFKQLAAGVFGTELTARCRNKNAEEMTDEELRSWLEDIERAGAQEK
jgi:hypothetical protein